MKMETESCDDDPPLDITEDPVSGGQHTRCKVILACVGVLLLVVSAISIPVVNLITHQQVIKKVEILNGSETYDTWQEPKLPIYMQIYVFNLTNPDEVKQGEKPTVVELGPYTYREHRVKIDIVHHENGTVTYKQIKSYHFVRHKSRGPDSDLFTTANMPLLTFYNWVKYEGSTDKWLALWIGRLSGELFITKSVRDVVFGYKDELLHLGMIFDRSRFYTDIVGVFSGKNNTDDGTYTIYTGEKDVNQLGDVDKYNGTSSLNFWTTPWANMVNGSDGTLAPPFLDKNKRLYMFSTDICRSVYGVYSGQTQSPQGLTLDRFRANKEGIASAEENPDNAGFCTPAGRCMGTGVMNLTVCHELDHFQVPIIGSFPHFYLADREYVDAVNGMKPDPAQHTTDIDVEPMTGIVMQVAKRLQINIYMEQMNFTETLKNIRTVVFPILWLNESAVIDDANADRVKQQLQLVKVVFILQCIGLSLGAELVFAVIVWGLYDRHRKRTESSSSREPVHCEDDEPLIS